MNFILCILQVRELRVRDRSGFICLCCMWVCPTAIPGRRSGEGTLRLGIVSCSVGPLPSYISGLPGSYLKSRPILYPELAPPLQSEVTGGGVGRHTPGKVPWQERWGPGWGQPWGLNYPLTSGKALLASVLHRFPGQLEAGLNQQRPAAMPLSSP